MRALRGGGARVEVRRTIILVPLFLTDELKDKRSLAPCGDVLQHLQNPWPVQLTPGAVT